MARGTVKWFNLQKRRPLPPDACPKTLHQRLLNAELRKHDACTGVSVDGISPVADDTVDHTWTASVLRKSAGPVPGQCSRIFLGAVRVLQRQYDLASEE